MKLSERAMIAALHVGAWTGSSHDRDVTEEVSNSHEADLKDAGRYSKQLISRKALRIVNSHASVARRTHRLLTLPWDDDGSRILSTVGYQSYVEQMRLKRMAFEAAVIEFCQELPSHINEARTRLGSMFDADDYPAPDTIQRKFYIDVEIKPVPEAGDFRAELSDASVKAIVKDIERRTEERLEAAVNDVFVRIQDVTQKMVERLRAYKPDPDGGRAENTFKDSLVWNIKELAELIPSLNITQDKRLVELERKLLTLTETEPEILRDNDRLRENTADKAEAIFKRVSAYL